MLWILFPVLTFASETDGMISNSAKYAWGEKIGWVNFNPTNGNVRVNDEGLTGYAWAANYGWINLSPTNSGVKNDGEGNLSGSAWNDKLGWLDFSGVKVDESGNFSGTAGDGSSIFGRLAFECDDCAVATDWRPVSVRDSDGQAGSDEDDGDDGSSSSSSSKKKKKSSSAVSNLISRFFGGGERYEQKKETSNPDEYESASEDNQLESEPKTTGRSLWWLWILAVLLLLAVIGKRRKINKD